MNGPLSATLPRQVHEDSRRPIERAGVLVIGLMGGACCLILPAPTALPIVLIVVAFTAVCVEPRLGIFALPLSIPWGSVVALAAGPVPVTITDICVAAVFLSWLGQSIRTRRAQFQVDPWILALSLLVLVMLASSTQAVSVTTSGKEIVKWLEVLVIATLAPQLLRDRRDVWIVLTATVSAGVAEALLGIIQFAFQIGPANFRIYGGFMRAYGTFQQPNPYAGYINVVFGLTTALAWLQRSYLLWAATLVLLLGTLVSFSRAGWVAAAIALVVVAAWHSRRIRLGVASATGAILLGALLAAFSIIPVSPFTRLAGSFGLTSVDFRSYTASNFSEIERAAHWVAGLRMFASHPILGVGIGNYPVVYPGYHVHGFVNALGHAHDYFINIAAEAGLLGLFAYTTFVLAAVWLSWRRLNASPSDSLAGSVALGALAVWLSSTFHNLFDVLYVHEIQVLLAVLMVVAVCSQKVEGLTRTGYHTSDAKP